MKSKKRYASVQKPPAWLNKSTYGVSCFDVSNTLGGTFTYIRNEGTSNYISWLSNIGSHTITFHYTLYHTFLNQVLYTDFEAQKLD